MSSIGPTCFSQKALHSLLAGEDLSEQVFSILGSNFCQAIVHVMHAIESRRVFKVMEKEACWRRVFFLFSMEI